MEGSTRNLALIGVRWALRSRISRGQLRRARARSGQVQIRPSLEGCVYKGGTIFGFWISTFARQFIGRSLPTGGNATGTGGERRSPSARERFCVHAVWLRLEPREARGEWAFARVGNVRGGESARARPTLLSLPRKVPGTALPAPPSSRHPFASLRAGQASGKGEGLRSEFCAGK